MIVYYVRMTKWKRNVDGDAVLRALAQRSGLTWSELSECFDLQRTGGDMDLLWCLRDLANLELITVDGFPKENTRDALRESVLWRTSVGKIRASDRWHEIEMVLSKSYIRSRKESRNPPLTIYPLFGEPIELSRNLGVFVLMPFAAEMRLVYTDHILPVVEASGFVCGRADDLFDADSLVKDVWAGICAAEVIICDCTGRNPNVFYELGIAHTVGKPVIIITQHETDVPADIKHIRYIKYDYTPVGMRLFESSLRGALETAIARL